MSKSHKSIKHFIYRLMFHVETPAERSFDIVLWVSINLSIASAILGTYENIRLVFGSFLGKADWFFTILFTIEYIARIWCAEDRKKYIFSFLGIIDFIAVIPTYFALIIPDAQLFIFLKLFRTVRLIRLLKFYSVLGLSAYLRESQKLFDAIRASRQKISVFLVFVITFMFIGGALMHIIEHNNPGFTGFFQSIYWTVVTITTVGYGDITPITPLGKILASLMMLISYGVIAVPTGLISAEIVKAEIKRERPCNQCGTVLLSESNYCHSCGDNVIEQTQTKR